MFYEHELLRVHDSADYRVEKVLRSRKKRGGEKEYFVKWKGWDDSFNSWVKAKDIYEL